MTGRDGGCTDLRGDMQGHPTQLGLNQKWGEHQTFKHVYISNCKQLILFIYSFIDGIYSCLLLVCSGSLGYTVEKKITDNFLPL